ncbi:ATP-binding protein [Streptomyces cylindrosporus]|uniref:ATP-binding protein n=1 Tax=Streptomyces cylindrosporus TaxID=2927583 RepID=A0ABS9Y740_9ACTN|nr:ATP-binding protein [Streptomyces cylindrosporus]MCI3273030.1 ATP-binding protein [Streptomyces cylindrosporus]
MEPSRSTQAGGQAAVAIGGDAHGPVMTNPVFAGPATPLAVAVKSPLGIFNAVSLDSFTGREWLIAEIDEWFGRDGSGYLWIESEAGLGKTALAAWLVRERGWFSHFARHAQGASARVALQNIAGQLICAYGLDEFAPGGMLPEWVHTPSGFEAVLTAASSRATDFDRPLVIVVDGADEAECTDDGLPWACRRSCRTGCA